MAFKDEWKDIVDGQNEIVAENINIIAKEAIRIGEKINDIDSKPIKDSTNFITSGGVYNTINNSTVRYVDNIILKVDNNNITENTSFTAGEGWSGTLSNGFTFSGRLATSKLIFDVTLDANSLYLIRFKMSQYKEGKVFAGIGNGYEYDVYMGGSQAIAILESDGGKPYIEVRSDNATFEATFTELSCCKITDNGIEEFEIHPNSIYRGVDKPTIGTWNVILGDETTMGNNINGTRNIGIGAYAFRNFKTGTRNIGIGTYSLSGLKKGNRNIGIGADALFAAEEAEDNVVIGKSALIGKHLKGSKVERNICIGNGTLTDDKDGIIENTIIGHNAGKYANDKNVLIGFKAGYFSKGNGNVSIGHNSFTQTQQHLGDNNTVIGTEAQKSNDALNGIVAIGYKALATKDNQCVLGGDNITETVLKGELLVRDAEGNIHKVYKEEDVINYVTEREATYSNSLKGNISGEFVNITDISPLTNKASVTVISNNQEKLYKTGKNLLPKLEHQGLASSSAAMFQFENAIYIKKGIYRLSIKQLQNCTLWRLYMALWDKNGNRIINNTGSTMQNISEYLSGFTKNSGGTNIGFYFPNSNVPERAQILMTQNSDIVQNVVIDIEFKDDFYVNFALYNGDVTSSTVAVNPQLEAGEVVTEYEPYSEPIEYNVRIDGLVEDLTTLSYPVTNLYTKSTGATINVSYTRDINKVIENLQNAIISLGGNI